MSGKKSDNTDLSCVSAKSNPEPLVIDPARVEELATRLAESEKKLLRESMLLQATREAWEMSEAHYQGLMESMEDIVFSADSTGRIVHINPAVETILGYLPKQIIGDYLFDYVAPADKDKAINQFAKVFVQSPQRGEYRAMGESGAALWFRVTAFPLRTVTGIGGVRCVASEISTEKMLQEELHWSQQQAITGQMAVLLAREICDSWQKTQAMLDSFNNMAQENPEMAPFFTRLSDSFASFPEALRTLASLDPGLDERVRAVNLNQSILKVFRLLRQRFERYGVRTTLSLSTRVPFTMAWPKRMEHAFFVLLHHASRAIQEKSLRSGHPGEINVTSRRKKDRIIIEFSDNGPGLSREDCQRIFDFNYCLGSSTAGGVGLHMSRSIIEDHGGSIRANASPEGGALFTIDLPVRHPGA
ncbi:MAG: PAS domain S-box protein [Desulfatibacillum sp.]|nr:PAS domain S-box protein [Desulfatibacillum sp.]